MPDILEQPTLDYASAKGLPDGGVVVETSAVPPEYDPMHPLYGRNIHHDDVKLLGSNTLQLAAPKDPMGTSTKDEFFGIDRARRSSADGKERR